MPDVLARHHAYDALMNPTGTAVPIHSDRRVLRTAFLVDAGPWLAAAGVSRDRALYADGEDWDLPYAVFGNLLVVGFVALGWGVTVGCALTVISLVVVARRTSQAHTDDRPATVSS